MRLSVRDFDAKVTAAPDSARQVRMRIGGLTYCMTAPEALALANQLADAVNELKTQE
jgi:hypothetical protein